MDILNLAQVQPHAASPLPLHQHGLSRTPITRSIPPITYSHHGRATLPCHTVTPLLYFTHPTNHQTSTSIPQSKIFLLIEKATKTVPSSIQTVPSLRTRTAHRTEFNQNQCIGIPDKSEHNHVQNRYKSGFSSYKSFQSLSGMTN